VTVIDFSLPSSSIDVSTPEGLLQVLKRGLFKPAQSQFKELREDDGIDGYCCLGVYAEVNGITYSNGDGAFRDTNGEGGEVASLPDDHWLFTKVVTREVAGDTFDGPLQFVLSRANDQDRSDSYDLPIQVLEAFVAGCRTFRWTSSHNVVAVFPEDQ
jgi:hypothetical protein